MNRLGMGRKVATTSSVLKDISFGSMRLVSQTFEYLRRLLQKQGTIYIALYFYSRKIKKRSKRAISDSKEQDLCC